MIIKKEINRKNYILNPCDRCNQQTHKDECSLEEFVSCQTKMALQNCLSLEYGKKYFVDAIVQSIEDNPDRNQIIRELFSEISKYIK